MNDQKMPPGQQGLKSKDRRLPRRHLSLTAAITLAVTTAILSASSLAGYYALNIITKNKLSDTWAIMFLEMEQQGTRLADKLRPKLSSQHKGDIELEVSDDGQLVPIHGAIARKLTWRDLGMDPVVSRDMLAPLTLVEYTGAFYLLTWEQRRLILYGVPPEFFREQMQGRGRDDATTYLITREGKLLYTSNPSVEAINFVERPLVRKFIEAPLSIGQLAFNAADGEPSYGFFRELQDSNLVMFAEVNQKLALANVQDIVWRFIVTLLIILLLVLFILQVPLVQLTGPLRELAGLAGEIGKGNFSVSMRVRGVGEVSTLSHAFVQMITKLKERDEAINSMLKEQREKVRIEGELKIVQSLQTNLLLGAELPPEAGLDIKAIYIPATECAGDWYGYHHDPETNETIVAIADVSGHGAGSAFFTAIIAGIFDRYRSRSFSSWSLTGFLEEVNGSIFRLGKRKWHATMILLKYRRHDSQIDIVFAGHTWPFINFPQGDESRPQQIKGPSAPLGMEMTATLHSDSIPFQPGSSLLLYTDGFNEARNSSGKAFGIKRIHRLFGECQKKSARQTVAALVNQWEEYKGSAPAPDDTCIIVMRAT